MKVTEDNLSDQIRSDERMLTIKSNKERVVAITQSTKFLRPKKVLMLA